MKNMTLKNISILAVGILMASCGTHTNVRLTNELSVAREGELVEIAVADLPPYQFKVLDDDGREVSYQITYDGKLVFPANIPAETSVVYVLEKGTPAPVDTVTYGRLFPERLDDFAWENDKAAYRAYGPALQASGEQAFGYDVWTKSTSVPVLEKRYDGECNKGISYHHDHGEGMDVYAVGPTLGGGTAALLDSIGELMYPYCFTSYEVLDGGPLRFTFKLVYDGDSIAETRIISLDRGSHLNRTSVTFDNVGDSKVAAGIVVHKPAVDDYVFGENYMAYADPTQNPDGSNGTIYIGVLTPVDGAVSEYRAFEHERGDAIGHILSVMPYRSGSELVYYWGSGWSKGGVESMDAWTRYLSDYSLKLANPIKVEIEK